MVLSICIGAGVYTMGVGLRQVNVFYFLVHLTIAAVSFNYHASSDLRISVALASSNSSDLLHISQNRHATGAVSVVLLSAFAALTSSLQHLLAAVFWDAYTSITPSFAFFRWVDYSISSTLMIMAISLQSGDWCTQSLIHLACAQFGVIWIGAAGDSHKGHMPGLAKMFYCLGCIPFAGITTSIIWGFSYSVKDGDAPWFVWAIVVGMLSLFIVFGVVQGLVHFSGLDPWRAEIAFQALSGAAKVGLNILILAGTQRESNIGIAAGITTLLFLGVGILTYKHTDPPDNSVPYSLTE